MQLKVEEAGACRKKICCAVPADAVNEQMNKYFSKLAREVKIPGFRQGKVPMPVVRKRFAEEARQETTKQILSNSFQEAVRTQNLRPVISPEVENFKQADDQSMSFDIMVEVEPEFELPAYSGLKLDRAPSAEPSAEEVDKFIDGLRESRAELSDSVSGKVGWDDYVLCDYSLSVDGKTVEERQDQWLVMAKKPEMEGFLSPLEGKEPGAEIEGRTGLSKDFPNPEVAGKTVDYRFAVKQIKNKALPALDEEFAKGFGLESLDAMRKNVSEYMVKEKEAGERQKLEEQIIEILLDSAKMDLPEQLFRSRVENMFAERMNSLARDMSADEKAKAEADIRKACHDEVGRTLKLQYVVSSVFEKEKMQIERQELVGRVQAMLSRIDPSRKDLIEAWQSEAGIAVIADNLRREKVMSKIIELAK